MNRNLLVISVTAAVVAAGATSATTMKNKHSMSVAGRYAAPAQPIPYAQLDSYLKGSRSERQRIESQSGAADTQTAQNGVTNPVMSSDGQGAPTGAMTTPDQSRPTDGAGSADASTPGLNGGAAAPQTGSDSAPPASNATPGGPMNGPAAPSATPNTPQ